MYLRFFDAIRIESEAENSPAVREAPSTGHGTSRHCYNYLIMVKSGIIDRIIGKTSVGGRIKKFGILGGYPVT